MADPAECPYCSKMVNSSTFASGFDNLKKHIYRYHKEAKCKICDMVFESSRLREYHFKKDLGH